MELIRFKGINVVVQMGKEIILILFVDTPIDIHFKITRRILRELEELEIGEVISNDVIKKVKERIEKYIYPSFP